MLADFEDALTELQAAVELMPDNLAAHALMAETYARIEHWGTSLEWLDKVIFRQVKALSGQPFVYLLAALDPRLPRGFDWTTGRLLEASY